MSDRAAKDDAIRDALKACRMAVVALEGIAEESRRGANRARQLLTELEMTCEDIDSSLSEGGSISYLELPPDQNPKASA